ncbi:response regulator transcription factor [Clostridium sartagoforme]|uniref:Stage 0 sporulation protein A homolog n=1 Tax=Clostridium sartagoforme TaxID=84031 RepID=A0A4S2DJJ9_9CLOT|nr:response regulator transcription factor [Clostridium sartagoforme]
MEKVLIIEDDLYIREELESIFEKRGYVVESITNFNNTLEDIKKSNPDLIVLDLNLPGMSGFEICKSLKQRTSFPVLILTSRNQMKDELHALDLGADDYLTKPCHPDRIIARAEKIIKMYEKIINNISVGNLILDEKIYEVKYLENSIILPENEGKILRNLMINYPKTVKKEDLFIELWGTKDFVDENILQVNMTRLRKSLSKINLDNVITTIRGIGYKLEVIDEE